MAAYSRILSLLVLVFTCSSQANVKPKSHKNITKSGHKRIDIQANKWREAQTAINSLIDESISNEVTKAKKEVKALLEKNIAKHLHEASKRVMADKAELEPEEYEGARDEDQSYDEGDDTCQDKFDNCAALATSGVCDTSREAMKKHCARTCELCNDEGEELPPATPVNTGNSGDDTWTIIGSDGKKFTSSGIQQGTRKTSITTAQVQKLLEYVKQHAPHLTLKKVKPGVLKLIRIPEKNKKVTNKKLKDEHKNHEEHKKTEQKDLQHDNYWTIKEAKEHEEPKKKLTKKAKSNMLHFDLSSILKDNGDLRENDEKNDENFKHKQEEYHQTAVVSAHPNPKHKSEEYLKHICHPMCKKTCISSCAPGCCAGEHQHDFPLYHRKSSHCHPFCKKHCISSCPLTCCAETDKTSKTWRHPRVHHLTPGCHPMCKRNCVPSCPKACCTHKPPKPQSHCHPLCKTNCLSSCPLSCCSPEDRLKEKCHPLCRKTCLPSCPDECCAKKGKERKLILKSKPTEMVENDDEIETNSDNTCPGLCPNSCAPACHSTCCSAKKDRTLHPKPVKQVTPSGCTANCVYECLPGCPPACCIKSRSTTQTSSSTQEPTSSFQSSPVLFSFSQPIMTPFAAPAPAQPVLPVYQQDTNQAALFSSDIQTPKVDSPSQRQSEAVSLFAPKHCPSSCLTHCSPECVRSDCCDLD